MRGLALAAVLVAALFSAVGAEATTSHRAAACNPLPKGRVLTLISAGGAVDRSFPDAQGGDPTAIVSDGAGGWFVAGGFVCVGGVHTRGLVHLYRDGKLNTRFVPALPASRAYPSGFAAPVAMTLDGPRLLVGGTFGVEALNPVTGAREWAAPVKGGVQGISALAATPSLVYVGGDFSSIGGVRHRYLAELYAGDGRVRSWKAPALGGRSGTHPPHDVTALALDGKQLFVGGLFSTVGGKNRPGFAAIDASSGGVTGWRPMSPSCCPDVPAVGDVETIVPDRGELLTAGLDGFGASSDSTGATEAWMKQVDGRASAFAVSGDVAYLAGSCRNGFTAVDGKVRNNLAAIDLATGAFTRWGPYLAKFACVSAIGADKDAVLVGGSFVPSLG